MNSKEIKKLLRQAGVGGMFGSGIRLFDGFFETNIPVDDMDKLVQAELSRLAGKGMSVNNYREGIADCDNWSIWIQSGVTLEWAIINNTGIVGIPLAFGRAWQPGHDFNIGICKEGVYVWNYGTLTDWDLSKIKEVELR